MPLSVGIGLDSKWRGVGIGSRHRALCTTYASAFAALEESRTPGSPPGNRQGPEVLARACRGAHHHPHARAHTYTTHTVYLHAHPLFHAVLAQINTKPRTRMGGPIAPTHACTSTFPKRGSRSHTYTPATHPPKHRHMHTHTHTSHTTHSIPLLSTPFPVCPAPHPVIDHGWDQAGG